MTSTVALRRAMRPMRERSRSCRASSRASSLFLSQVSVMVSTVRPRFLRRDRDLEVGELVDLADGDLQALGVEVGEPGQPALRHAEQAAQLVDR